MPTKQCSLDKKIAQTLFLGASVSNFNVSLGWGGQPSQLTVNLVEDKVSPYCDTYGRPISAQFAAYQGEIIPNHYHDCVGDDCYMLPDGSIFNSDIYPQSDKQNIGKVFYSFYDVPPVVPKGGKNNCFLSNYWFNPDPGFLGIQNRINKDGTYINIYQQDNTNLNPGYDIINCPVFFKVGDFSFGGVVQNWTRNQSSSGDIITVTIEDMKSVLSNCYIILDKFSGAVYSKIKGVDSYYGGPRNWLGSNVDYIGRLYNGNIPNVFNVYGFLESFGIGSFGSSRKNKNGISVNRIIDAISVLTGNMNTQHGLSDIIHPGYAPKTAFSPFARILTKTPQTTDTFENITSKFNTFGIIPPSATFADGVDRCQFVLDLSEFKNVSIPDDFFIAEPVMSITDFISRITDEIGYDFTIDLNPVAFSGKIYNVIKLKLVSRNKQPIPNQIQNTVNQLICDGYQISSASYGKEKNNTNLKSLVIGANQQRLLQIKSNRLAYTQTNLILNSKTLKFVNYDTLGDNNLIRFNHGKYRFPSAFSTNNPDLSRHVNPNQKNLYDANEELSNKIAGNDFSSLDTIYTDKNLLKSLQAEQNAGNYYTAIEIEQFSPIESNQPGEVFQFNFPGTKMGENYRFFPMYKDAICPFFGYVRDEEIKIDLQQKNTDFRRIRPVYLDTWTGQTCVLIETHEFPQVSLDLIPTIISGTKSYILISESEIRAALAGFDNFLVYSLAKIYRPDLLESLRLGHRQKYYNKLLLEGINPVKASEMADKKYDWFWRQIHGNIAGPFGQPVEISPAKNDGASYIDQKAIQDYQILHQFVQQLGGYYGKQYMVSLPNLQSYKDQQYSYITIPTQAGDSYVFKGGGSIYYNYEPTSDGAWEEPGNIIDDSISVGGSNYYALADSDGKIGTILGYNSNKYYDYAKSEMCRFSQQVYANNLQQMDDQKINPAWSYQIFDEILNMRDQDCPDANFIFNGINISSLPATEYVDIEVNGRGTIPPILFDGGVERGYQFNKTIARDAWGEAIGDTPMRKLYVKAQVDPSIKYIEPENLFFPKAIVTSPGLSLNTSSSQYKKDPNRTVITNVSSEDLLMYLKTTDEKYWDYEFIAYLMYYVSPNFQNIFAGNYAVDSEQAANHVEIAPKAAHPFFAGIPIKFNNYVYGPWANNVYVDYLRDPESIFPTGKDIKLSDTLPYQCTTTDILVNEQQAKNLIDNFIGPTSIEIDEQLAPWNFGGAAYMDQIANIKAYSKLNYQSIIESAQIKMPGLPLFDLGSDFSSSSLNSLNYNFDSIIQTLDYTFTDIKSGDNTLDNYFHMKLPNTYIPNTISSLYDNTNILNSEITYSTISLATTIADPSTVITNIQVNIGNDGIYTTYSLRTYTKKLSLFNKTDIDRITKQGRDNVQRNKQIASISQQNRNIEIQQFKIREDKRLSESNSYFDSVGFSSKLFGWSPTTVLIGQASPYLKSLQVEPDYIPSDSLYVQPSGFGVMGSDSRKYTLPVGEDIGNDNTTISDGAALRNPESFIPYMLNNVKYKTDVGLHELKEVRTQLDENYGMQSAMSLDGILSPVSFYPTHKNSTFSYTKYDIETCPFCRGTKKIKTEYKKYTDEDTSKSTDYVYCDKCERKDKKLKYTLSSSTQGSQSSEILPPYVITNLSTLDVLKQFKELTSDSGSSSAVAGQSTINLISLNPILASNGQFRNPNTQNYQGEHPDGKHEKLIIGGYSRPFFDRCRHSIEIVARGSIPQNTLTITDNVYELKDGHQPDFYNEDLELNDIVKSRDTGSIPVLTSYQMNQRFFGLRGPLTMHAWGYDTDGYPIPNAADEPLEIDTFGRPKRFKMKIKNTSNIAYREIPAGGVYRNGDKYFVKGEEEKTQIPLETTLFDYITYENNLNDPGGFLSEEDYSTDRVIGYQGDIISKTQKWDASNRVWTKKSKLNEFYLNFGERPDLWPVGPIDLRWDSSRNVWTVPSSANIYKMVYVTLEEDLIKPADHYDETFAARAYLDELEYGAEPLPNGSRRLIYVKDKSGWTAPRGAKFLCRYDSDSGFYEPVSKPSYTVFGKLISSNEANISMHYVQGKAAGSIPTMKVTFDNKLNLSFSSGANGFFNYDGGKWILISVG